MRNKNNMVVRGAYRVHLWVHNGYIKRSVLQNVDDLSRNKDAFSILKCLFVVRGS